jgi:two-component system, cell cycle sensor histidine kinase and response regulator CckA
MVSLGNDSIWLGNVLKLLLVDDHPEGRAACARLLTSLGHEVDDTGDPDQAVVLLRAAQPPYEAVVLDLFLGETDGLSLLSRLEETTPELRVLFISGDSDAVRELRMSQRTGMLFIEKPFSAVGLQLALDRLRSS